MNVKPKTYYQHKYGGLYYVPEYFLLKEDGETFIVYVHMFPYEKSLHKRLFSEFIDGRFRELTSQEADVIINGSEEELRQQIEMNKIYFKLKKDK